MSSNKLALIGFMGSGKTSIARSLALQTGLKHYNLDKSIEDHFNLNITEIFATKGERWFRTEETILLSEAVKQNAIILDLGGGAILKTDNQKLLQSSQFSIIYLKTSLEVCRQRIVEVSTRPLLNNPDTLEALYLKRLNIYESLADFTIETDRLTIEEITAQIIRLYFKEEHAR